MPPRPPPPPPGLLAPPVPSKAQLDAVHRLVWDNVHAVEALEAPALRAILPVLKQVRDELRRDLARWLSTAHDANDRFTAQRMRVALRQVQASIDAAARLEPVMASALKLGRRDTGALAAASLETEIARFGSVFGESIRPVQLDTAAVIARGDRLMWKRHKISGARYGGQVGDDIRHQLAVGVAKGETFAELKARLVKHGGPRGMVALRGRLGDPNAVAEYIAEGLFARYRHWAERLVRTELMHAYNLQHQQGLALLNQNLDAGQEPYVRLWDAAADRRVCPICRGLDGKTAPMDGLFVGGYDHPPAHPYCRCVEVAWHASWGTIPGERQGVVVPPSRVTPTVTKAPGAPQLTAAQERALEGLPEGIAFRRNAGGWSEWTGPDGVTRYDGRGRGSAVAFDNALRVGAIKQLPDGTFMRVGASRMPAGFARGELGSVPLIDGVPTRAKLKEAAIYVLDPREIQGRLVQLEAGVQEARRQRIREGWANGVRLEPVKLAIRSDGKIEVIDGRHRLAEAISQGRRIAARFVRGV